MKASGILNEIYPQLVNLSRRIYEKPELGNQEFFACSLHEVLLEEHGFKVERSYVGIPTAFKATYESGKAGRRIGYFAEYDGLPGIGHGCGHNILGAASTGAGIVLAELVKDIGGSVVVFGTPAEETEGAKVDMAEKGCFADLDAALLAHPENRYCRSGRSFALEAIKLEFHGKASHAATSPEKGISALEGVIQLFVSVNGLRQHMGSDCRINGIIKNGGAAPNVIPDYASAEFYVRAATKSHLMKLSAQLKNCAKAAALSTGTKVEISNYEASYLNLLTNQAMSGAFSDELTKAGCAKICDARASYGSIDMGNVSHCCPTIHPYFDIVGDGVTAAHTREFADASVTDYANEQMKMTVMALAMTGARIISDQDLFAQMRNEFLQEIQS